MCFRPAGATADMERHFCPECGEEIKPITGIVMKKCPHCKCDLMPYLKGEKTIPSAPTAAPAPKAPAAPATPAAPKVPKV